MKYNLPIQPIRFSFVLFVSMWLQNGLGQSCFEDFDCERTALYDIYTPDIDVGEFLENASLNRYIYYQDFLDGGLNYNPDDPQYQDADGNDMHEQWLDLYLPNECENCPLIIYSHSGGQTAEDVYEVAKWFANEKGIAFLSWESASWNNHLNLIVNPNPDENDPDLMDFWETSNNDFRLVCEWAARELQSEGLLKSINLDEIFIAGRSRGSRMSFLGLDELPIIQSSNEKIEIAGVYFLNAFPDREWTALTQDPICSDWFGPPNEIVNDDYPPLVLDYMRSPGIVYLPGSTDNDAHDVVNGFSVIDEYECRGIPSRISFLDPNIVSGWRNNLFGFIHNKDSVLNSTVDFPYQSDLVPQPGINLAIQSEEDCGYQFEFDFSELVYFIENYQTLTNNPDVDIDTDKIILEIRIGRLDQTGEHMLSDDSQCDLFVDQLIFDYFDSNVSDDPGYSNLNVNPNDPSSFIQIPYPTNGMLDAIINNFDIFFEKVNAFGTNDFYIQVRSNIKQFEGTNAEYKTFRNWTNWTLISDENSFEGLNCNFSQGTEDLFNTSFTNQQLVISEVKHPGRYSGDFQVEIFSLDGKLIYSNTFNSGERSYRINLNDKYFGIFPVRISSDSAIESHKLFIEN